VVKEWNMPQRRRVSLLVLIAAGFCVVLGGLGCNLSVSFLDDPTTVDPPNVGRAPVTAANPLVGANPNDYHSGLLPVSAVQSVPSSPLSVPPGARMPANPIGPGLPQGGPPVSVPPPGGPGFGPGGPGFGPGGPGGGAPDAPNGDPCNCPPTELRLKSHPEYKVEPPDILLIDAVRLIPRPPYVVGPLDVLLVRVAEPLPNQPIDGTYTVTPEGTINLGYSYGVVRVGGLTLEGVEAAIRAQLGRVLKKPQVAVGLAAYRGLQQVRGTHLVRQDGTISLGTYGCVYVAGLTLCQVRTVVEKHLSQFVLDPEISVDVYAYNSKVYYVIADGAGYGQQIYRFPITGKETVLDALSNIRGLPPQSSKKRIWLARPSPCDSHCLQVLPIDYLAIVEGGSTCTNYQLFPGDRIYLRADPFIEADNTIAKVLAPFERVVGAALLFGTTIQAFRNNNNGNGNGGAFFVTTAR
jgi:polysaccharide export outer membrane protein